MSGEVQKAESVAADNFTYCTHKKKENFLEHFVQVSTIKHAAALTGISRRTVYDWSEKDPDFAKRFEQAKEDVADHLEKEAIRRACEGINKPVYYQGQKVDTYKEYSDTLLIFLLKGQKPEKYGDKVRQEHTGADGGPIQVDFGISRPRVDSAAVASQDQPQKISGEQEIDTIDVEIGDSTGDPGSNPAKN